MEWGGELRPTQNAQLIFDQEAKPIQWRRDDLFHKSYWRNWTSIGQKKNLDLNPTPYTKINLRIIDLSVKCKTTKHLAK